MKYKIVLLQILMVTFLFITACLNTRTDLTTSQEVDSVFLSNESVDEQFRKTDDKNISYSFYYDSEKAIEGCKDSLHNIDEKGIPKCLYDKNLDMRFSANAIASSTNTFYSLRLEIIKRMQDVDMLKAIIRDPFFKIQFDKVIGREIIPSDYFSNYDFAVLRLKEIQEGLDTLSKIEFRKRQYQMYYWDSKLD